MSKKVAILIISHKDTLSPFEIISIRQCYTVLSRHDIFIVCPKGLNTQSYHEEFGRDIKFHFLDPKWLKSYESFERLKITPLLYSSFSEYEYILFYEPDAFVFRDNLEEWCQRGYDYIGAPWLEGMGNASIDAPYVGVGNGGLSLRKTSSHLRVLNTFGRVREAETYWRFYKRMNWKGKAFHFLQYTFGFLFMNNFHYLLNNYKGGEDDFWGNYANKKFPWFKVAPVSEGLKFSMEVQPRRMFRDNHEELPFGCHAWWRYDLDFWRPYIERFGYSINK